jgi:hypothetical protein
MSHNDGRKGHAHANWSGGESKRFYDPGDGGWRGSVAWNDNHVKFSTTHKLDTQYGTAAALKDDNLFEAAGTDAAYMIYSGP